ncbi:MULTISPECIES: heparinase II/III family protein [Pseudovibrio]|uniref:heparinase II/III family protein n=1 Tax=Stappiaceae TaxID=2821832 RepID=UPI0023654632|nr:MULTISPECIES: heparinase II/III family protein [Pseudovibrio]MDD7909456.1 heparinase II/III family protein [Pseudovibrio exalbescens]MDX5595016.1 heparinase II/III family protein [Pseudovibrio sp. SPO723]
MALGAVSEQALLWRLMAQNMVQAAVRALRGGSVMRFGSLRHTPSRLLIAPQDLRTTDATNAADIYAGRFLFSGHLVETGGESPFEIPAPSVEWARALHGFSWLRHLRAAETAMAQKNARALVEDWIKACGRGDPVGWRQEVIARRILSWMAQSPLLLQGCEADFYRKFMRSLGKQVRYLRRTAGEAPDGVPRLTVAMAVACASVSIEGQERHIRKALKRLDMELQRQILPDGGHVSRHPGAVLDILVDLLPIRQALVMQGQSASPAMMEAIDRMMPIIRFFRHGDGSFAHFNGMGSTPGDVVATVLAYDDARGAPSPSAPYSGYQRLSAADSLVIMDAGAPPPIQFSGQAHAGTLSFEFSSHRNRIVVNCGVSQRDRIEWRAVARSTAAHSTASVGETSSSRFLNNPRYERYLGTPIVSGPRSVSVERYDDELAERVIASHDGYAARFHLIHERDLTLSRDGTVLDGVDRFQKTGEPGENDHYTLRFHLHPTVKCSMLTSGQAIILQCPDGEAWEFMAEDGAVELEESIYLSDVFGHRRTNQIVIYGRASERPNVTWMFRRVAAAKGRRKSN